MSKIICDFCGATDSRDNPVIAGDNVCICKSCVTAASEIMNGNVENINEQSKLRGEIICHKLIRTTTQALLMMAIYSIFKYI